MDGRFLKAGSSVEFEANRAMLERSLLYSGILIRYFDVSPYDRTNQNPSMDGSLRYTLRFDDRNSIP